MARQQGPGVIKLTVWRHVRVVLADVYRRAWRQARGMRGILGRIHQENASTDEDEGRRYETRARFWAEFREGQREAEARSTKRDP